MRLRFSSWTRFSALVRCEKETDDGVGAVAPLVRLLAWVPWSEVGVVRRRRRPRRRRRRRSRVPRSLLR